MNVVRFIAINLKSKLPIFIFCLLASLTISGSVETRAQNDAERSRKISQLIGRQCDFREIGNFDSVSIASFQMGEHCIDPSMVGPHGGRMKSKFVPTNNRRQNYSIPVEVIFWLLATPLILLIVRKIIF
jgi:hypothetical protein